MKNPIVIIGLGELGELFASGFLKSGHPVYPILRGMDLAAIAAQIPEPELVLVAVGEADLHAVLTKIPPLWLGKIGLIQNELLPKDWLQHGINQPSVMVVWFDKKKGRPCAAPLPSPASGPKADLMVQALQRIEVPCYEIPPERLLFELVKKNLYILTINLAGLHLPPTTTISELWNQHQPLALAVFDECYALQQAQVETQLPREELLAAMLEGFAGDPQHICCGRSAPARLQRAIGLGLKLGIPTPTLNQINPEREPRHAL